MKKPATIETTTPRLLDLKAAAVFLGSTVNFVRGLVRSGAVPHVKLGKKWAVDVADLEVWITRNKTVEVGANNGATPSSAH